MPMTNTQVWRCRTAIGVSIRKKAVLARVRALRAQAPTHHVSTSLQLGMAAAAAVAAGYYFMNHQKNKNALDKASDRYEQG